MKLDNMIPLPIRLRPVTKLVRVGLIKGSHPGNPWGSDHDDAIS
jgi:hypothetical protein